MKKIIGLFAMSLLLLVVMIESVFADLSDLELGMVTDPFDVGSVGEIRAVIRNPRPVDAGEFKVVFEISPSSYRIFSGNLVQTVPKLAGGSQLMAGVKVIFDETKAYTVRVKVDPYNAVSESNENNNEGVTYVSVGQSAISNPPMPSPPVDSSVISDEQQTVLDLPKAGVPSATPAYCGVPASARSRTDAALLYLIQGQSAEFYHGKKYGHLYLEGGYVLSLKKIEGKTAVLSIDGQTINIGEGQNKEINGVIIYMYNVGEDYIDYCIHETESQYTQLMCKEGCAMESKCFPVGSRAVMDNAPSFCGVDTQFSLQKEKNAICQNNYECISNFCSNGTCRDIGLEIETTQKELEVQKGILNKIIDFLKRLFNFS